MLPVSAEKAREIAFAIDALQLWLADLRVKLDRLTYLQVLDRWNVIKTGIREIDELISK